MQATISYGGKEWEVSYEVIGRGSVNVEGIHKGGDEISQFLCDVTLNGIEAALYAHLKNEAADAADSRAHAEYLWLTA